MDSLDSLLTTQNIIDSVSLVVLTLTLFTTLRIILFRWLDMPKSNLMRFLTHPIWCFSLLVFVPWTLAGFARQEIPHFPWQAFAEYSDNGYLSASAFFMCVLVVDMWMFLAFGQLISMLQSRNVTLSDEERLADSMFYFSFNLLVGILGVIHVGSIYNLFQHINDSTEYFVFGITALALYFHLRFTPQIIAKAPAILTTCGILGTFFGIAIGLMDFNPNEVQRSVPALIDGIKTAFWASAVGIFFALTVKLREVLFGGRKNKNRARASIDDLVALMAGVQQALIQSREDSNARMDEMLRVLEAMAAQSSKGPLHIVQESTGTQK